MRTLFIAPQPFYEDRGTPLVIKETLEVLSDLGYCVDVATYPIGSSVLIPNVRLIRTANPLFFGAVPIGFSWRKVFLDLFLLFTCLNLAFRNRYACIHGVEEGSLIGLVCKTLFGIPAIYDMHSSLPEQLKDTWFFKTIFGRRLTTSLERFMVNHADCIIASRGLADHVKSIAPEKKVFEVFFRGVEAGPLNQDLAQKLGINGHPTVVYTGSFAAYQGLDLLMEAAVRVRFEIPEIIFLLVGGTEFDIPRVLRCVENHKLKDAIKLIPRCPRVKTAEYLALADVLVLPRMSGENAPRKLFDYMGSGKPIVATDIPAHRSILSEQMGLLVPPSPQSFAQGIAKCLQDPMKMKMLTSAKQNESRLTNFKPLSESIAEVYLSVTGASLLQPAAATGK